MFRTHASACYPHRAIRLAVVLKLTMLDVMSSLLRRTPVTEEVDNWLVSIRNYHVWLVAFLAGCLGNAVTKVGDVIYDRAKL